MKKKTVISVRDIAKATGLSKSTVGYVLRNQPGPSQQTRESVLRVAHKLGYTPDARIASWMAQVRGAQSKDLLPIAWVNTNESRDAWHEYLFLRPYFLGMQERCAQLGYRVEEIWSRQTGMTAKRISQILYHRGIEGVVITPPATHLSLDWKNLAGVALGAELLGPRLHRVNSDFISNLLLALKMLKRAGYRRIGICLSDQVDRNSNHVASALASHLAASNRESKPVPPLFYWHHGDGPIAGTKRVEPKALIIPWLKKHRPDVVICHDNRLEEWAEEAGYKVPKTLGIVHLALDDDVLEWAGIFSNRREIGRTTAELVISLVQNRQFGVPKIALDTNLRGTWRTGRTLLIPKP